MREHQIVITLKPEQFLEVQRLARAASAKSMGIFVRQQLLSALGIDVAGAAHPSVQPSGNVQPVLNEIKRLHGELKTFVAESLSLYSGELTPAEAVEPLPQSDGASSTFVESDDDLEQAAQKAFTISPRLGAIGQTGAVPIPHAQTVGEPTGAQQAERVKDLLAKQEQHQRSEMHHFHQPHVPNDILDRPYSEPYVEVRQAADIFVDQNDPLQRLLAEDAPAAKATPQLPGDLDGETQTGGDDFDVNLSLAERHRLLLEQQKAQTDEQGSHDQESLATDPNIKPSTAKPSGYPPFSGSPPPKRRQV